MKKENAQTLTSFYFEVHLNLHSRSIHQICQVVILSWVTGELASDKRRSALYSRYFVEFSP